MSWRNGMYVPASAPSAARGDASWRLRRPSQPAKQAALEDSNIAGLGSKEDRSLRAAAAGTDKEIKGAGQKVGLQVWRVENRRSKSGAPEFGVKKWPRDEYGSFFTGDAYIVLNTYKALDPKTGKPTGRLAWDLYFWLGSECTQDEKGVAAIKTVEIDTLLNDGPVQYRETQYNESRMFQSLFKEVKYMEGGIDSGFRQVEPVKYVPRLFMLRSSRRTTRAYQIPCSAQNMNHGDVFVLDAGLKVYKWIGATSTAFEKSKGGMLQCNLVAARNGRARKADVDDAFWAALGGTLADVRSAEAPFLPPGTGEAGADGSLDATSIKVFRISEDERTGIVSFTAGPSGSRVKLSALESRDVFLIHTNIGLWIWIGRNSSQRERANGFAFADKYITDNGLAEGIPVTRINEASALQSSLFMSFFTQGMRRQQS